MNNTTKRASQEDIVLAHLMKHGSITSMTAFRLYNITRLAAKVFNLRHAGYQIDMYREAGKGGTWYGRYVLRTEEETA